jgi:hypothetical protein
MMISCVQAEIDQCAGFGNYILTIPLPLKRSHFFNTPAAFGSTFVLRENFAWQTRARFCRLKNLALPDTVAIANIHTRRSL